MSLIQNQRKFSRDGDGEEFSPMDRPNPSDHLKPSNALALDSEKMLHLQCHMFLEIL